MGLAFRVLKINNTFDGDIFISFVILISKYLVTKNLLTYSCVLSHLVDVKGNVEAEVFQGTMCELTIHS